MRTLGYLVFGTANREWNDVRIQMMGRLGRRVIGVNLNDVMEENVRWMTCACLSLACAQRSRMSRENRQRDSESGSGVNLVGLQISTPPQSRAGRVFSVCW